VSAGLVDAQGNVIYLNKDQNMDDKAVPAAIALELQRGILVALQHSPALSDGVENILKTVNAMTATADQIGAVEKLAVAFSQLEQLFKHVSVSDITTDMAKTPMDRLADQSQALQDLATNTDITTDSLATLTQATAQYRDAVAQLVAQYQQAKTAIGQLFTDTIRTIHLQNLDNQGKYNFYQSEADSQLSLALQSNDASAVQAYAQRINQDIIDAFNLLTPDQQRAQEADFTARAQHANDLIQQHLDQLSQKATDDLNAALDKVKTVMEKAATDFNTAAGTNLTASQNNLDASTQHQQVDVNISVEDNRLNTTVTDGG
jgi:hypothetical protein